MFSQTNTSMSDTDDDFVSTSSKLHDEKLILFLSEPDYVTTNDSGRENSSQLDVLKSFMEFKGDKVDDESDNDDCKVILKDNNDDCKVILKDNNDDKVFTKKKNPITFSETDSKQENIQIGTPIDININAHRSNRKRPPIVTSTNDSNIKKMKNISRAIPRIGLSKWRKMPLLHPKLNKN